VEVQRRAVARDPLSAIHTSVLAVALLAEGKYPEAREWARRAEELSPGYLGGRAHDIVGWAALEMGHPQEALASWEHVADATTRLALRVIALHALGRELESRDALARLEREHPDALWLIASARARTGDVDGAFEVLDRVVRERRGGFLLKVSVALRPLRGDPRFKDLLRGLNLPVD
jgi:tetratricopeptide (TPR) repeat protein